YSWIEVAADDRRFGDETYPFNRTHYKWKQHGHYVDTLHAWVMPVHMIFDESVRRNNCLGMKWMTWNMAVEKYDWSDDNSREVEKGWITRADSIADLAVKLDRGQDRLVKTVAEYNAACADKADTLFNRDPSTLEPLETPPFYAIELKPGLVCTSAGAKRTPRGEVLNRAGEPIPGLYEAGQLGSMISDLYQNGTYLTEAMISGRSAGRNAVRRSAVLSG
ncbi:MAG: FAD-binding protein, partial [bacterium]|nr:FAD-binding protein [bacterium]